jgi:hypothetical protein
MLRQRSHGSQAGGKDDMNAESARELIFAVIGLGLFIGSMWEIWTALTSGRARLRIAPISRAANPKLFWFEVGACGFTALLAAVFAYHFISRVLLKS